jgi:hypothetical protein
VDNATIEHVRIGQLGSNAIYADGSGNGNGIPRISTIRRNILSGGIAFPNAGDTLVISENQIDGDDGSKALDVTFAAGASSLTLEKNNIVSKGGIRIGGYATATKIVATSSKPQQAPRVPTELIWTSTGNRLPSLPIVRSYVITASRSSTACLSAPSG